VPRYLTVIAGIVVLLVGVGLALTMGDARTGTAPGGVHDGERVSPGGSSPLYPSIDGDVVAWEEHGLGSRATLRCVRDEVGSHGSGCVQGRHNPADPVLRPSAIVLFSRGRRG